MGAAMDAANMLKPALVRGDFRVIGATTDEEYERWICNDPALERRFQRLIVRELSSEETLNILRARQTRLERHHHVLITEEALRASVSLTDIHQTDRRRPDRAIDVIDEACAHAHAVARYSPRAEELILRRRVLLRTTRVKAQQNSSGDDSLDQFARNGMATLRSIGAELEAMFNGPSPEQYAASAPQRKPDTDVAVERAPESEDPVVALAEVEAELAVLLQQDRTVVGGVDVARVVAVSTGHEVTWAAP
jgi:ATP-dependent Clp protease ATP-binding subunit ClpA